MTRTRLQDAFVLRNLFITFPALKTTLRKLLIFLNRIRKQQKVTEIASNKYVYSQCGPVYLVRTCNFLKIHTDYVSNCEITRVFSTKKQTNNNTIIYLPNQVREVGISDQLPRSKSKRNSPFLAYLCQTKYLPSSSFFIIITTNQWRLERKKIKYTKNNAFVFFDKMNTLQLRNFSGTVTEKYAL